MARNEGFSLGAHRRVAAQSKASRDIAAKVEKQRRQESSFGGFMSLLSPLLSMASGGIFGLLGLKGGLLAPLIKGGITTGLKGLTEKTLRDQGAGAQVKEIEAEGKYGYGKRAAKGYREAMQEGIKERSALSPGSIAAQLVSSYTSALAPKWDEATKSFKASDLTKQIKEKGLKTSLLGRSDVGLFGKEIGGLKGMGKALGGEEGIKKALAEMAEAKDIKLLQGESVATDPSTLLAGIGESVETVPGSTQDPVGVYSQDYVPSPLADTTGVSQGPTGVYSQDYTPPSSIFGSQLRHPSKSSYQPQLQQANLDYQFPVPLHVQGEQLDEGIRSALKHQEGEEWFQQGGLVAPNTIADFFEMQGKSLGGSNKKSLAQILGRR